MSPLRIALLALPLVVACTNEADTEPGDSPADAGPPTALGSGLRIASLNSPASSQRPANNQPNVAVTGATFIIKDTYNENNKASSVGSVYVQDFASASAGGAPEYSGIQLYKTTYEPASLALAPGDVVDFIGEYQEYNGPSTASFGGQYQPEMYEPIVTFRFDYSPPEPRVIPVSDLESWETGYKWMSMLVTVVDTVGGGTLPSGDGAASIFLTSDTGQDGVAMDNELYPLDYNNPKYATNGKTHFTSVTGVVTYFFSFHIAPRSDADIQSEPVE